MEFSFNKEGGTLKMHIDAADSPIMATTKIKAVNGWRKENLEFASQAGVHDIYLTYSNPLIAFSNLK